MEQVTEEKKDEDSMIRKVMASGCLLSKVTIRLDNYQTLISPRYYHPLLY